MVVMGVWAFILCTGHRWLKTREQTPLNNTKQIFLEQKTKKSFPSPHLCPEFTKFWSEFGIHKHLTNCQFIWSGKVYIWLSVWGFQKLFLWQPCLNKFMHVENWESDHLQHDLYVDISNKFTLAWVFVSHACTYTQITVNSFMNYLVLSVGIIQR